MDKILTQGTVISSLRSKKYFGEECFAVIITARCDLANNKVGKVFFLEALPLDEWVLSQSGMQYVLIGSCKNIVDEIEKLFTNYGLDWETIRTFSLDEFNTVVDSIVTVRKDKERIKELYGKYVEITKEYTNKDDRKNVIRNHKKDVCNSVNKIVSGQNTHYVYIPSDGVSCDFKNGLIVDLQEVDYFDLEEIEDLISCTIDVQNDDLSDEKKIYYNKKFYIYEGVGYAIPTCNIKSPWIKYLMQHFSNVFSRIGIDTPRKEHVNKMIEEIYNEEK